MSNVERLESHMIQLGLRYEPVGDNTWVLYLDTAVRAPVGCKLEEPIILLNVKLFDIAEDSEEKEALFRKLLELNAQLLHSSYGLQGNGVVLSAAHQIETLDFPEFQAMIDDMSMALDNHLEQLRPFAGVSANDEGSA